MSCVKDQLSRDGVPLIRLESEYLRAEVAPSVGGRVVSLIEQGGGHELLWRNSALKLAALPSGSDYDPNFYGGIDELLPNDIPEIINGISCPDHGELWTLALECERHQDAIRLWGDLPRFGLRYEREMRLRDNGPWLDSDYRISNLSTETRTFLWKLHAAVQIEAGDVIDCPARRAQVVDLNWSRYRTQQPFDWPLLEGQNTSVVPAADGTVDFFYLFELQAGRMTLRRPKRGLTFSYHFDRSVFPYAWLFASYGGFEGHYTAILEPCTAMPISVPAAAQANHCSVLAPGQTLATRVSIEISRSPAETPARER
jgi:hypothetical protein